MCHLHLQGLLRGLQEQDGRTPRSRSTEPRTQGGGPQVTDCQVLGHWDDIQGRASSQLGAGELASGEARWSLSLGRRAEGGPIRHRPAVTPRGPTLARSGPGSPGRPLQPVQLRRAGARGQTGARATRREAPRELQEVTTCRQNVGSVHCSFSGPREPNYYMRSQRRVSYPARDTALFAVDTRARRGHCSQQQAHVQPGHGVTRLPPVAPAGGTRSHERVSGRFSLLCWVFSLIPGA